MEQKIYMSFINVFKDIEVHNGLLEDISFSFMLYQIDHKHNFDHQRVCNQTIPNASVNIFVSTNVVL